MDQQQESIRLTIPHLKDPSCTIVGTLEQLRGNDTRQGQPIALILHGMMGHKDYLFLKRLAKRLDFDSFRFDFRGHHETGGKWKQGAIHEDVEDLESVVAYLKGVYGYRIDMLVGHSRGSIAAFRWMCTSKEATDVSCMVNASARYRMQKILESARGHEWEKLIQEHGHAEWTSVVARKEVTVEIHLKDLDTFIHWDTSIVCNQFPGHTDVLTLHGLSDHTVPPYDAVIYANALSARQPGTHSLHLMEDADHNFTGRQDEVVDIIIEWLDCKRKGQLRCGVWIPDTARVRP